VEGRGPGAGADLPPIPPPAHPPKSKHCAEATPEGDKTWSADKITLFQTIFPFIALMAALGIGGWVLTTWMRIKNGYPLENSWGPRRSTRRRMTS
jgi:hypothetical protein